MSTPFPVPAEFVPRQHVTGNVTGRDLNLAGRDNNITNYLTGLRHLRPRTVVPDAYMPPPRFVVPPNFEKARRAVYLEDADTQSARVVVLVAPENSGRKSAALRLLMAAQIPSNRIFELLPDWENPDVACLPKERRAGYLLNLRGATQPLPQIFIDELIAYATELRAAESCLVITANEIVWSPRRVTGQLPGVAVVEIGRPQTTEIVKKYLQNEAGFGDRITWLDNADSVFRGLLPQDAAPDDAVRLASLITKAENAQDKDILDEYHGWETHLNEWFSEGGEDKVEERAKRISGAFLNGTPASVVLDSADLLLAAREINWPIPKGGPLAIADAERRLQSAGMAFDGITGIASLRHESQGPAILRRIWTKHVQLSAVLTRWLQDVSQGPAKDHLGTLAASLAKLAETVGVAPIFALAEGWLQKGEKQHLKLVGDLISDLAVHPTLGSKSRSELARWAKGKEHPERQRAVALACMGIFGRTYPSQALTRARYIIDSPGNGSVRDEAIKAVRELAAEMDLAPLVIDTVIKWLTGSSEARVVRHDVFFEVYGSLSTFDRSSRSPVEIAFSLSGESGDAVRSRLFDGWKTIIAVDGNADRITESLLEWRRGAEDGRLPLNDVVDIVLTLGRIVGIMEPPFEAVIMPDGPFKDALITGLVARFGRPSGDALHTHADTVEPVAYSEGESGPVDVHPATQ